MTEKQVVNVIADQIRRHIKNARYYNDQMMLKAAQGQWAKVHTLETLAFRLGILAPVNTQTHRMDY